MTITMNISHLTTIHEIKLFLESTREVQMTPHSKESLYLWLNEFLTKIAYHKLKKKEKRLTREFIIHLTQYSQRQLKRLISKHKKGELRWEKWQKGEFSGVYDYEDISLLHRVDGLHQLSGKAIRAILKREYEVFKKEEYRKLSHISVSHIYNLRGGKVYERMGKVFEKTRSTPVSIGLRQKPRPEGRPGYLRVDSVHLGDLGKRKGIYFVNMVDEVTQFEFVFCLPSISARYMKPILETLIRLCPFTILGFHSDNGSEYINKVVAQILNRFCITQTKSRSRKSSDNALVESKNGSIIRKHFGYMYIPATEQNTHLLNVFCINFLNPYLNYHRPCAYAVVALDSRGKEKKTYPAKDYKTPYEKLKGLPGAQQYLKPGLTFEDMDKIAYSESDTEFAGKMQEEKKQTFLKLNLDMNTV